MFTSSSSSTSDYSFNEYSQIMQFPLVLERPTNLKFNTKAEIAPNCPRCASSNTKFCYYNNYSFTQPRYFCKGCRRYWTKGGSLRNVPVGGGCRKSRRSRARQSGSASCPTPGQSSEHVGSTPDIDLAAVFAKYVTPNSENDDSSSLGTSSTSSDNLASNSFDVDSQTDDVSIMFEYENREGLMNADDDEQMLPHFLLPIHEDVNCQDFMYQNSNEFKMHSIMGDISTQNTMWSEGTNFQDLGSQESMVQMQDFGFFSANCEDDQLRNSENLISDNNWGTFDISAYEIF